MKELGSGLAWVGFWLFLAAASVSFFYAVGEHKKAKEAVKIECIKAGRAMGGPWYRELICLERG